MIYGHLAVSGLKSIIYYTQQDAPQSYIVYGVYALATVNASDGRTLIELSETAAQRRWAGNKSNQKRRCDGRNLQGSLTMIWQNVQWTFEHNGYISHYDDPRCGRQAQVSRVGLITCEHQTGKKYSYQYFDIIGIPILSVFLYYQLIVEYG